LLKPIEVLHKKKLIVFANNDGIGQLNFSIQGLSWLQMGKKREEG